MELYPRIVDEFSKLPHVKEWESLQSLFRRVASGEPGHWLLPLRVCEAVGGDLDSALPAVLAVACMYKPANPPLPIWRWLCSLRRWRRLPAVTCVRMKK